MRSQKDIRKLTKVLGNQGNARKMQVRDDQNKGQGVAGSVRKSIP